MAARNKILLSALIVLLTSVQLWAQATPILERKITLTVDKEPLSYVLDQIGRQGGFSFSYNTALLPVDRQVTLTAAGRTVRDILNELFQGTMLYKEKPRHLILTPAPVQSHAPARQNVSISGYVTNAAGDKLADVSLFEKESLTATVSDAYGYFSMELTGRESATLQVRKEHYRDTLVLVTPENSRVLAVVLQPAADRVTMDSTSSRTLVDAPAVPVDTVRKEELKMPYEQNAYVRNIRDTLYRDIQISLLPFVGSNGRLSGNVINNYSINIFGGYSLGTRKIELGFFVNMDRGDVSFLQLAGMGNLVGKNVYGVQAAGFFNINGGETKAVQGAGFANVNFGEMRGVQMSGFSNINLEGTHGVQVAGFNNYSARGGVGVQIAGFNNVVLGEYTGSQVSGFANINAGGIHGTQLAGFANISNGFVHGSQLSAGVNFAGRVRGTQIGLFNYSDTLGGVPIGLVSFVNRGYHKIELSADEVFHVNVGFRTGVKRFYNILLAGVNPTPLADGSQVWTYGYGLGTAQRVTRWLYLNFDATGQQVNKGNLTNTLNLLSKFHFGVDVQLMRKLSVYAGVTLNGYLHPQDQVGGPLEGQLPSTLLDSTFGNDRLRVWPGWKVGLRVL